MPQIQIDVLPAPLVRSKPHDRPLLIDFRHSSNGLETDSIASDAPESVILLDFLISKHGIIALDAKTTATDPTIRQLIDEWDSTNVGAIKDTRLLGHTFRLIGRASRSGNNAKFTLTKSERNGIAVEGGDSTRIDKSLDSSTEALEWSLVSDAPIRLDSVGWSYGHRQLKTEMQINIDGQIEAYDAMRSEAGYLESISTTKRSLFTGNTITFSQVSSAPAGAALSGMVFRVNYGNVPSQGYKNCITIMHRNFPSTSEKAKANFAEKHPGASWERHLKDLDRKVKAQFETYQDLGVEILRLPGGLTLDELKRPNAPYSQALKEYDTFAFKMNIDTAAHVQLQNHRGDKSNLAGATNI